MNEMLRAEGEELAAFLPALEKLREAAKQKRAGNADDAGRLLEEAETLSLSHQPKFELGRKLRDVVNFTEVDGIDEMNTSEIALEMSPHIKTLIEQYVANYQKKEKRIAELRDKKANLAWWANLTTYAAVSLQLFGLMFVLVKDLAKDSKDLREKADKATKKAEEEAKKATAEAEKAKAEADNTFQ